MAEQKIDELKISEEEANAVRISNSADRPNAFSSYRESKKTAADVKKMFDAPFELLRAKHDKSVDELRKYNAAESEREAAETAREEAETERANAEEAREEAETERANAEQERKTAEITRDEKIDEIWEAYETGKLKGDKGEKGDPGSVNVVDGPGDSETDAMSQKATTEYVKEYIPKVGTRNLLNVHFENANLIFSNGVFNKLTTGVRYAAEPEYVEVIGGETYTISFVPFATPTATLYVFEYAADKTFIKFNSLGGLNISPRVLTVSGNCSYVRVQFNTEGGSAQWETIIPNNLQMELGAEATEYIPPLCIDPSVVDYSCVPELVDKKIVQCAGEDKNTVMSQGTVTEIAKRVGGINLFTGIYENGSLSVNDGSLVESSEFISSGFIPVKKGLYYYDIYGGYISNFGLGSNVLCFYDKDKNFIRRTNFAKAKTEDLDNAPISANMFLAPDNGFVRFQFNTGNFVIDKICVIESDVAISKMSEMPKYSYSAAARFAKLEAAIDLSALGRNQTALHNLNAASKYGHHKNGKLNQEKRFTALITTDVHSDSVRLKNAIEILNGADAIDCGFCLGDIQGSDFSENDGTWYTDIVNTSEKPFYTILGNHDQANYSTPMTGGTPTEGFNKLIQPTLGVLGQAITKPYYKVLYDTYKIAVICLNNYDAPTEKNADGTFVIHRGSECISTEQLNWFIEALTTIPTDYHLIIARHSFPSENQPVDNEWSQPFALGGDRLVYSDNNIIPDIVNAWINGSSLTKTYAPSSGFEICPTHNVNVNFSSRGKGNFVCYLVGHSHTDAIRTSDAYEDQVAVGFCATANDSSQNFNSDLPRVSGTRSDDAITAVTVDTASRKIRLVRFGSDITFDLAKRDITTIDY